MAKKEPIAVKVVDIKQSDPAKERAKEQAKAKADDARMLTTNNPLVEPAKPIATNPAIIKHNMKRLEEDAHLRRCGVHSAIYSQIMDNRYGG